MTHRKLGAAPGVPLARARRRVGGCVVAFLASIAGVLPACRTSSRDLGEIRFPDRHIPYGLAVVSVEQQGRLCDPVDHEPYPGPELVVLDPPSDTPASGSEIDARVEAIVDHLFEVADARPLRPRCPRCGADDRRREILIYVHGGMNTWSGSGRKARRILQACDASGGPAVLCVQWNSEPFTCLWDQWLHIRQGRRADGIWPLATPLYIAYDLVQGVAQLPITAIRDIENSLGTAPALREEAELRYRWYRDQESREGRACTGRGRDPEGSFGESLEDFALGAAWLPFHAVTLPFVSGIGPSDFENMKRRASALFHVEAELDEPQGSVLASGGLARVLRRLDERLHEPARRGRYRITLAGHSMGAIVVNETLREFPQLPVTDIVYLAAACSLRDYHDSAIPHLREHPDSRMHHVVLCDDREEREPWPSAWFSACPNGSLLSWIDMYLSSPTTALDRTAGRYVNLIAAETMNDQPWPPAAPACSGCGRPPLPRGSGPHPVRDRIEVRQFHAAGAGGDGTPQQHGEVDDIRFWDPNEWLPVEQGR